MASLCLGMMTFVASARRVCVTSALRVWRSIMQRGGTVLMMLGLALHLARAVLHGRLLRGPNEVVGYICLLLRLVLMRLRPARARGVLRRS